MKKLFYFLICILLVGCATHFAAEKVDFDTHTYKALSDTLATMPIAFAFRMQRRKVSYVPLPRLTDPQKLKNVVVCQDDPLNDMLAYENGVNYHSDVWLLTNLERLKFSNKETILRMLDERFQKRELSNPYANMSDDDIFATIRAKDIQSASELHSWLDYLESEQLRVKDEISLSEQMSKVDDKSGNDGKKSDIIDVV